jgi:hypothetical protein
MMMVDKSMNVWVCDLCYSDATEIGIIAPRFALTKEKNKYKIVGGAGHSGSTIYTFVRKPVMDPEYSVFFLPDEEADAWYDNNVAQIELADNWIAKHLTPLGNMRLDVIEAHYFWDSCVEMGFNPKEDNFYYWLINKCGFLIDLYETGFNND